MVCISRNQKHDYANYDQFAPNFDMVYKAIQRVSIANLKFSNNENKVMSQKSWRILYYVIWENGCMTVVI